MNHYTVEAFFVINPATNSDAPTEEKFSKFAFERYTVDTSAAWLTQCIEYEFDVIVKDIVKVTVEKEF